MYFLYVFYIVFIIIKNASTQPNFYQNRVPVEVDTSGPCPKLVYSPSVVVRNCSSLNLAVNWAVVGPDNSFISDLILSNNQFRTNIPYDFINKYDSLKGLDLSYNLLDEKVTDLARLDCSQNYLISIILNYNRFSRIPMFNITCMNLLQQLRLSNNKELVVLDNRNTFDPSIATVMSNLALLDVSFCNIETLNMDKYTILQSFPSLLYLNLIGNRIRIIYENPFVFTPNLKYLSFERNNIECFVENRWMKYYVSGILAINSTRERQLVVFTVNNTMGPNCDPKLFLSINDTGDLTHANYTPTCFNALLNQTVDIPTLDDDKFYSYINLTTSLPISKADNVVVLQRPSGTQVDLDCTLYSEPESDLWWTFNERVLSKIVTPDSPYVFIENFTPDSKTLRKTSTLRIKNAVQELSGNYSCRAFYIGYEPNDLLKIATIQFLLTVLPGPAVQDSGLSPGALAGIIIGSLLAFLLLCLCIFLLVCCCCYRRGLCCFKHKSSASSTSSASSSALYKQSPQGTLKKQIAEMDHVSGFRDINRTRPNYVINTISKAQAPAYDENIIIENCKRANLYPDSNGSWRILGNENINVNIAKLGEKRVISPPSPTVQTKKITRYVVSHPELNETNEIRYSGTNENRSQMEIISDRHDSTFNENYQYDETLVYNVHSPFGYNRTLHQVNQQHGYSENQHEILGPQMEFTSNDVYLNDNNIESRKQYIPIKKINTPNNFNHINNSFSMKYDSDV